MNCHRKEVHISEGNDTELSSEFLFEIYNVGIGWNKVWMGPLQAKTLAIACLRRWVLIQEHFEEIFSKYAKSQKNALTLKDIAVMLAANRNIMDPVGWTAGSLEWVALWWIASDENVSLPSADPTGGLSGHT